MSSKQNRRRQPATKKAAKKTVVFVTIPASGFMPETSGSVHVPQAAPKQAKVGKFPYRMHVKYARYELHGRAPLYAGTEKRPAAASNGEHTMVREFVTAALNGKPTIAGILQLAGYRTVDELRRAAEFSPDANLKPLRKLGAEFKPNAWAQGRYLAGILVAWIVLDARSLTVPVEVGVRGEILAAA